MNQFKSLKKIKWCPGCGNYLILNSIQNILNSINISNKKNIFVSGIGCSSRLPYYINSYGFHTIHGRATSISNGIKLIKPNMYIWIITGDGDAFSIGLNHIIHLAKRNLNINIILINNNIYALTKGQYSPMNNVKLITKYSKKGTIDYPINPIYILLSINCSFISRTIDNDYKNIQLILIKSIYHHGTSFIEILQNCKTFNNKYNYNLNKLNILNLNKKLNFGKNNEFIIYINSNIEIGIDYIHNTHSVKNKNILINLLSNLHYKNTPFPLGIFQNINKKTYEYIYIYNNFYNKILNIKKIFLNI